MRRFAAFVLIAALFFTAFSVAGEALDAPPPPEGWGHFLGELVRSIDVVGFALIVVLILYAAMCVDLFTHLRISRLLPDGLLADVQEEMSNGEYEKALDICQKSDSLIAGVFAAVLAKTDYSFDRMAEVMRGEVDIQGLIWRQWVGQFKATAVLGLLLGFGGSVIEAMRFVADLAGRPNIPLALASSAEMRSLVHSGLFCLLVGVGIAATSLLVHTFASSKLEKILLEAARIGEELLDPFRPLPAAAPEE